MELIHVETYSPSLISFSLHTACWITVISIFVYLFLKITQLLQNQILTKHLNCYDILT